MQPPIQDQTLIKLLNRHYEIDVYAVQAIVGGADMNALTYKAQSKSKAYFVKLKYSAYDAIHLSIISLLHEAGIKEIIFPIPTREAQLFQQLEHTAIIVYPFIEAANGFIQDLTQKQWQQLGKVLKKIHGTIVPTSLQQRLRKEMYLSKWREIVRSFYSKIELDDADDDLAARFKSFFKKNITTIHQLVDTAEELSNSIQANLDNYVLCHSDIHAGNVLVDGQESIYIIDWDEPMLAPKERDLMFIGGGVGNVWNKSPEMAYFYKGYGQTNIDKTMLSYYRHERIIEDMALYGQDLLSQEKNNTSRLESLNYFKSMFKPNDVIEIAFATKPT